jgi:hypothetical protein
MAPGKRGEPMRHIRQCLTACAVMTVSLSAQAALISADGTA